MAEPASNQNGAKPQRTALLAVACLLLVVATAMVTVALLPTRVRDEERSATDVPLGVEEAIIIRYTGPRLVARPYRRGASVNLRIANEIQKGDVRIYDVRYVVSLPGEFDLTEYLTSADGTSIEDLPAFTVRGLTSLTKDIETRIQEIEKVDIEIWHWYHETLAGLGAVWIVWLVGLIFIGRPKRPPAVAPPPPKPSVIERIRRYLDVLSQRELTVDEKTQLEALLLLHWRDELGLDQCRMAAACRQIERSGEWGRTYTGLQAWLHKPGSKVGPEEFLDSLRINGA
jgi:hypothetical protein